MPGSGPSRRGAGIRAALCVGLGHVYAGHAGRGWALALAAVSLLVGALPAWVYGGGAHAAVMLSAAALVWLWQVADAVRVAGRASAGAPPHLGEQVGYYAVTWVLVCAALGGVVRPALVEGVVVAGRGMAPGLLPGDRVLVAKAGVEPRHGDVVVFEDPDDGALSIMRVVGLPGDRVEVRYGRLFVNEIDRDRGSCAEERYDDLMFCRIEGGEADGLYKVHRGPYGSILPVSVPTGSLFLMADNRGDYDEIVWREIPSDAVVGHAGVVWWSESPGRGGDRPIRWDRIGARL